MPALKYSYGDPNAIRACISVAANSGDVEVSPTSEPRPISLELENKTVLTDPNAIARYIGEENKFINLYFHGMPFYVPHSCLAWHSYPALTLIRRCHTSTERGCQSDRRMA